MATNKTYPCLTADEAAVLIPNGGMVAVSGHERQPLELINDVFQRLKTGKV